MLLLLGLFLCQAPCLFATTADIPDFVNRFAPLVYIDQNEQYFPSDLQTQLDNTYATINHTNIRNGPSPLLLSNLDQLNSIGNCTVEQLDSCSIYLTSKDDVTANPQWLYGVSPDLTNHETKGAKSCVVIINDHGDGLIDAFYMYFYAFNLGNTVSGQTLGDHVGDWEHTMVRFVNGLPTAIWLSQHDSGQAFAYEALSKNGNRPIVYSAIGTHANYAVPGNHSRSVASVVINDTTSAGFLWDPILSAYYYAYNPFPSTINERFTSADSSVPVSWLSFLGRWGDNRYADKDPRQLNFLGLNITWRYESGPRGPFDKGLNRRKVCPDNGSNCTILNALPPISGLSRSIQSSISTSSAAGGTASAMTTLMSSTASAATVTAAATAIINGNQSNSARLLETKLDVAKIVIPVIVVSYNVLN